MENCGNEVVESDEQILHEKDSTEDKRQRLTCSTNSVLVLQNQLSEILSQASKKILTETDLFYEDMVHMKQIAVSEERERNFKIILALDNQVQFKDKMALLYKYYFKWKMFTFEKKRENLLTNIALQFYKEKLMRKMFSHWLTFARTSWKKKMELKIIMEVYENQRAIVDNYEAKIKSLTRNKSELNEHLNSLHKSFENSLHAAFLQGFNHVADKPTTSHKEADYCEECSSYLEVCHHRNTPIFSDTPFVSYKTTREFIQTTQSKKHPSSLPKRLPIAGTATYNQASMPIRPSAPIHADSSTHFVVEKHIPISLAGPPTKSTASKTA